MAPIHTTRRVYSADQLQSLRNTKSQPRLNEAIEEHDGDDAELVKEHVLRGSKSFAARSWRSRASANSLRIPSINKENRVTSTSDSELLAPVGRVPSGATPILGEIAPNNQTVRAVPVRGRRSPTSSIKRRKVEAIVKLHGSPTHVRVTAGGRIVPSEQSPLCHPRYGYSAIKSNGGLIKFAPNHPMGKAQWTQATQNGFIAQDINGRLCQIINGTVLPLNEVDGALQLFMPAPNLNITQNGSFLGSRLRQSGNHEDMAQPSKPILPTEPSTSTQTNALELEYSKLELELKEVDRTEVLHGRTMGKAAKDALVTKRRELVLSLDNVRKALKSLKQHSPPPDAPTSPRAMQNRPSGSPPRGNIHGFLQHRPVNNLAQIPPPAHPMLGNYFGPQQTSFIETYGFPPGPPLDHAYHAQPWSIQSSGPAMYVPPPPFDGSMSAASLPYSAPMNQQITSDGSMPRIMHQGPQPNLEETHLPQNDGASSLRDNSPRQSRALSIKAPETKPACLKSSLNPMSPAYNPSTGVLKNEGPSTKTTRDRVPTPLSPRLEFQPQHETRSKTSRTTDDTISPTKRSPHIHSSSVSSFETADFFPRNTCEYSTRRDRYPVNIGPSEEKENQGPVRHDSKSNESSVVGNFTVSSPPDGSYSAPPVPPATPTTGNTNTAKHPQAFRPSGPLFKVHAKQEAVPDRNKHNASPKSRRQDWLFVQEHPECDTAPTPSSSPAGLVNRGSDAIDFLNKSPEWIEGYRAGLNRHPVGADRQGQFLDGYCSGLLKSAPTKAEHSSGSPVNIAPRRPSPVPIQPKLTLDTQQQAMASRSVLMPFETSLQSLDTLKQAVYDPQNEDAILTPVADGPHANEPPFNLGAWAKTHEQGSPADVSMTGYDVTSSGTKRKHSVAEVGSGKKEGVRPGMHDNSGSVHPTPQSQEWIHQLPPLPSSPAMSSTSMTTSNILSGNGNRVDRTTSGGSNLYAHYPGHRVISPHLEWKSASSVAHHAGLASGFFAQAQFDEGRQSQRQGSPMINPAMYQHSRFKEGSLDGISSPATASIASPPMSPRASPSKDKTKDSPSKNGSPARAKFEHIAEKVGIKAVSTKDQSESATSPGKRRWRDVWRGSRKDQSKDES